MISPALVSQFDAYARAGGHLLLTCRTGLMDETGQLWEGPTAMPILPLIGATIEAYDGLPEDTAGRIEMDDRDDYTWGVWGDLLYPHGSTRTIARYADQFYAGAAAVTQNRLDRGTITYCGVYAEPPFYAALVESMARQAGLPFYELPDRVQLLSRGRHRILLNYNDKPVTAPASPAASFVIGQRQVEPAGVAVWSD
jgi:beta-galactosidase